MARRDRVNISVLRTKQKKANKYLAKQEKALRSENMASYHNTSNTVIGNISQYFSLFGENGKIPYPRMMERVPAKELATVIREQQAWKVNNPKQSKLITPVYSANRFEELSAKNRLAIFSLAPTEQERLTNHLNNLANNTILLWNNETNALSQAGRISNINEITGARWHNGANFSDRIWSNKEKLANTLDRKLREALIRGDSFEKISHTVEKTFNVSAKEAQRLVFTEGSYVLNEVKARAFESEASTYTIETVGDSTVCSVCQALQGESFKFSEREPGMNFPPFHPSCRCSFITDTNNDTD